MTDKNEKTTDLGQVKHSKLVTEPADEVRSSDLAWHGCHVGGTYKQGLRLGLGSIPTELPCTLPHRKLKTTMDHQFGSIIFARFWHFIGIPSG